MAAEAALWMAEDMDGDAFAEDEDDPGVLMRRFNWRSFMTSEGRVHLGEAAKGSGSGLDAILYICLELENELCMNCKINNRPPRKTMV